ncbi:Peroxidase [Quillaja saponaria]|uniref:Peroxidase n=1 Tax=Quillaja saponaria TaxID=32244 RepID=A0AAD7PDP6_QUISA|nr:Peroxidase [Quillaja saponaria]
MPTFIFNMDQMPKISFLIFLLFILFSFKNQNTETERGSRTIRCPSSYSSVSSLVSIDSFPSRPVSLSMKNIVPEEADSLQSLEYDFYRESCPQAEQIIRAIVQHHHQVRSNVAPALVRLAFHDCFIEGCDASVLLDAAEGLDSEKESPPNQSLKGFDVIEAIKSKLEEECPEIVSCADILVVAARDSVVLAGGPFYPLYTGRRDGSNSFSDMAMDELPSPHDDLSKTLASFASRGFSERETVSLLGAHSIGMFHCKFFQNRLYNFSGTNVPDPSLDIGFLDLLRSRCNGIHASFSSSLPYSSGSSPAPRTLQSRFHKGSTTSSLEEKGMALDYNKPGSAFGKFYYQSLLEGKGFLHADQQLMAWEGTGTWVKAYALDASLFQRDFALAMMKLSNLQVLTAPLGQIRLNCSKVA